MTFIIAGFTMIIAGSFLTINKGFYGNWACKGDWSKLSINYEYGRSGTSINANIIEPNIGNITIGTRPGEGKKVACFWAKGQIDEAGFLAGQCEIILKGKNILIVYDQLKDKDGKLLGQKKMITCHKTR